MAIVKKNELKPWQNREWCIPEISAEFVANMEDVLDLNTHKPASLYEAFPPTEACRILKRLEFHHTPKHGSWLNMAEIEFSVFSRQCLDRRIGDEATLKREIKALEDERNAAQAAIEWRFTCRDAREKLHRIYSSHSS